MIETLTTPTVGASPAAGITGPELGAIWDGEAVDFRVVASRAERVTLCLFDHPGDLRASRCVDLHRSEGGALPGVWHRRLPKVRPGQLYGYRVDGPWSPRRGLFHNPAKLLIDPWARALSGEPRADPSLFGQTRGSSGDPGFNGRDSAGAMPKGVVVDPSFDWRGTQPPRTPWSETVIYEAHVRGLTRLHPELKPELRGTYLGLASPPVIEHLKSLGVTAVELLPVHQAAPEAHLLAMGKRNYWGYAPVSFFAPSAAYARRGLGQQVREFQTMVRELHRAGLEVLLDVVFNHSAEGGFDGPLYGPKAFDARGFYRWSGRRMVDWTGCGNTLDLSSPLALYTVLSSLRYWVQVMGVDGFRFDLAPATGRGDQASGAEFSPRSHLFRAIEQDPVLAACKWIAEPWDLGPGGYRLGDFPPPWSEWNDRFRDAARRFWRGDASGGLSLELARRLGGSPDLFGARAPRASLNYVTAHDGFTLADLVSYEKKHNLANGEDNRDGRDENFSANWGAEGPSDDPQITRLRDRARRNLLATLFLARGIPMLAHGDELGRTQRGNNNVYCQDNELSWQNWSDPDPHFLTFVRRLTALRRQYRALREPVAGESRLYTPEGRFLEPDRWMSEPRQSFILYLPSDEALALTLNGSDQEVSFNLSFDTPAGTWRRLLETASGDKEEFSQADHEVTLEALSLALWVRQD